MKEAGILRLISSKLKDLPNSQRVLGEYIMTNYKDAASLSALDLGKKVGVSDATVIRFAKSLGYTGYPEIKRELFTCLTRQENPSEKMVKAISRVKKLDSALTEVFQHDIDNIQETLKSFSKEQVDAAVQFIYTARRTYILGLNSCESLAHFLNFHLRRLHLDVHLVTSAGQVMYEQMSPINHQDVLVVISYPRYSWDSLNAIELAKERKSKVVSITDKAYCAIAEASDIPLVAHSTSPGFYNSYAAATTICNVLILSIAMLDEEKSLKALKSIEEIKKDIYI